MYRYNKSNTGYCHKGMLFNQSFCHNNGRWQSITTYELSLNQMFLAWVLPVVYMCDNWISFDFRIVNHNKFVLVIKMDAWQDSSVETEMCSLWHYSP